MMSRARLRELRLQRYRGVLAMCLYAYSYSATSLCATRRTGRIYSACAGGWSNLCTGLA